VARRGETLEKWRDERTRRKGRTQSDALRRACRVYIVGRSRVSCRCRLEEFGQSYGITTIDASAAHSVPSWMIYRALFVCNIANTIAVGAHWWSPGTENDPGDFHELCRAVERLFESDREETEESIRSIVSLMCQQRREILGGSYFSRKINLQKMQIDFGTIGTLFRNRSYPRIVRNWNRSEEIRAVIDSAILSGWFRDSWIFSSTTHVSCSRTTTVEIGLGNMPVPRGA